MSIKKKVRDQVCDQVYSYSQVLDQVHRRVYSQVLVRVRNRVFDQVRNRVFDQMKEDLDVD